MGLSAGMIGLPNVGKSTIFNALCHAKAATENYPFCTIDPNVGVAVVPDNRLARITTLIPTKKAVPAFIELVDIAGLVRGASKGEGLGNQFLGHLKNVDAIVHVVRCFRDSGVVHIEGSVDPLRDVHTVEMELLLKDLETVTHAVERVGKAARSGDTALLAQAAVFERARAALAETSPVRSVFSDPGELKTLEELHLLTTKQALYVANVDEEGLEHPTEQLAALREYALCQGSGCIALCGKVEAEIAELDESDRGDFLRSMGLGEPGLNRLTREIHALLGLRVFFTAQPAQSRAWTIPAGMDAAAAAGRIHSDFERGFVAAEVFTLEDLERLGSVAALAGAGLIRQEGRDYVVRDGDIIQFRFVSSPHAPQGDR
jgi:GTP-binding protein YchF